MTNLRVIGEEEVRRRLTYARCIPLVRDAMIAFSNGDTRQLLRSIIPLADGHMFGVMPGALGEAGMFGAKLVSVYPGNFSLDRQTIPLTCAAEPILSARLCGSRSVCRGDRLTPIKD